jgi:hypothetical protein
MNRNVKAIRKLDEANDEMKAEYDFTGGEHGRHAYRFGESAEDESARKSARLIFTSAWSIPRLRPWQQNFISSATTKPGKGFASCLNLIQRSSKSFDIWLA